MSVEIYNNEDNDIIDYLPEGSILIQILNDTDADLYALCLFDSGSTNPLINQRLLPPFIQAKTGSIETTKATSPSTNMNTNFTCALTAASVYAVSTARILHAKYEKSSPMKVVNQC